MNRRKESACFEFGHRPPPFGCRRFVKENLEPAWRDFLPFQRLKGESFCRQGVQMIRQIPRGLSHLADAARRSWRKFNPPSATLLFYEVTLAVPDAANRQPVFVCYANHRHMGNLPQWPRKSRMRLPWLLQALTSAAAPLCLKRTKFVRYGCHNR
jgi:hypothetical protein